MDEFHGDPLERICKDLFAKVLSLLDAASLARSVSVSRKWKFVAESHSSVGKSLPKAMERQMYSENQISA
jgi:hypothetical protein